MVQIGKQDGTTTLILNRPKQRNALDAGVIEGLINAIEEEAQFGALEMRRGFPAAINTPVLSQLVSPRLALEFLMFGDLIPARRLYEVGLINRLVEGAEALNQVTQQFVGNLCALDVDAVRMTKESHRAARNMPLIDALEMGKLGNALIAASGRMDEAMRGYADREKI